MIPGFHTAALSEHDLPTAAALARQCGYEAIAIRVSRARLHLGAEPSLWEIQRRQLAEVAAAGPVVLDADGLYVLDAESATIPSLFGPPEESQSRRDQLRALIDLAAELGVPIVTSSVGVLAEPGDTQSAMDTLAGSFSELVEAAAERGVTLALRPRTGHFVDSLARFDRLLRWMGSTSPLQLAADVGAMVGGGEMPVVDLLERNADRLACVYLSEARMGGGNEILIGQGHVSAARVASGLQASQFAGPVIVEPSGSEPITPEAVHRWFAAIF